MDEKEKQLMETILTAVDRLPPEKAAFLLGYAQGMAASNGQLSADAQPA